MQQSLCIQGQIPTEERDLGTPARVFWSNRVWCFTYDAPIRIPSEFPIFLQDPPQLIAKVQREDNSIIIVTEPTQANTVGSEVFIERTKMDPGETYDVPKGRARLTFLSKTVGGTPITLKLECLGYRGSTPVVRESSLQLVDDATFDAVASQMNAPRALATRSDLPDVVFERLVSCPDPITKALLIKNPLMPTSVVSWACCYPRIFRDNPAMAILFNDALVQQHLSTFPPDKLRSIKRELFP